MAEAPHFSPDELDRLEDALESLEGLDLGLLEDESDVVRERLGDYQHILLLTREAMPFENVPSGLLDDVLDEARNPADALGVASAEPEATGGSWWTRFRRTFLVPVLAVAGSAALILVIVQPRADESAVARADAIRAEDRPSSAASAPAPPAATPPRPAESPAVAADAEDEAEPQAAPEYEELATARAPGAAKREDAAPPVAAASDKDEGGRLSAGKADPSPADPKAEPQQATPRWDLIAQGDRARTDGDCTSARRHYEAALSDTDDRVQARANAGLGLCEAQFGRQSAADELYERAKDLDPEISLFLDQQSPAGAEVRAKPAPKKKARTKSNRKASPAEDFDALE